MNISSEAFVLGCSAIGAGLALIAGIGPGIDRVSQQDMQQQPLVEIRVQKAILCQPCFWVRL